MPQLRKELDAAADSNDVHRLEKAVQEFRRSHEKGEDLLIKAYERLYHLHRAGQSSVCLSVCLSVSPQGQVVKIGHCLRMNPCVIQFCVSLNLSVCLSLSVSVSLSVSLLMGGVLSVHLLMTELALCG